MALVLLLPLLLLLPHTMAVRLPRWSIILILHVQLDLIFFVLAPQDLPHREEQEELDWALDQLPHHRTKRSPQSVLKDMQPLQASDQNTASTAKYFSMRLELKCVFLQVSLPDRGEEVGNASWIPTGAHSHPCSSFSQVIEPQSLLRGQIPMGTA